MRRLKSTLLIIILISFFAFGCQFSQQRFASNIFTPGHVYPWESPKTASTEARQAAALMVDLARRAITLLVRKTLNETERNDRFRALLRRHFAIRHIARKSLSNAWDSSTPMQRQNYLNLFEDWIIYSNNDRFKAYSGQMFRIMDVRIIEGGDRIVYSEIIDQNKNTNYVDWYIRRVAGEDRIIDVLFQGLSLQITQRDEFQALLIHKGGMEGLLTELRKRVRISALHTDPG